MQARTPRGPRPGGARGHAPEQYGDHTLHGLSDADKGRCGACPREAEGRTEAERAPAPRPPGPPRPRPLRGDGPQTPPPSVARTAHGRAYRQGLTRQQLTPQATPGTQGRQAARPSKLQGGARAATQPAGGGILAETFKPTPAATGGEKQGTKGGQRRTPARPPPPLSPLSPSPGRGMLKAGEGDVGPVPPPPGQRSPPPPPPPPPARGPRHPGRSAARPIRRAPPNRHPTTPTVTSTGLQSRAGAQGHPANRIWAATRAHEAEQYGDHTLHGLSNAEEARFGARPREAEGQTEAERPLPPAPRGPPTTPPRGGGTQTPPPPSPPDRPRRTSPPTRGHTTQSQARGERDRTAPPPPPPPRTS